MKNEKISKDTLIAFLAMVVFLYLIPGILYFFNPGFSFKSLAIAFVFIQLILSDSFLEKYNVLRPNRLRIDSYRIITTNLTDNWLFNITIDSSSYCPFKRTS